MAFRITETKNLLLLSLLFLIGLTINYRRELSTIYVGMVVFTYWMFEKYPKKYNVNQVKHNSLGSLAYAIGFMIFFIVISLFATTFFQSIAEPNLRLGAVYKAGYLATGLKESSIESLQTTFTDKTLTVIANNIATIVTFSILIPFIETMFVTAVLIFLGKALNVNVDNLRSLRTYLFFLMIGAGMMWLHQAAKGVTNNLALAMTFIFFTITPFVIVLRKESETAVDMHILNNGLAIFKTLRWI